MSHGKTVGCPVSHIDTLNDVYLAIGEAMKILEKLAGGEAPDAAKATMRAHGWLAAARSKVDKMRRDLQSRMRD